MNQNAFIGRDLGTRKFESSLRNPAYRPVLSLMLWLQLRLDYDTTTIRPRRIARTCFYSTRFDASKKMNMSIFRRTPVVIISQSNWTQIVISITSVVVECVVVSSDRSSIVVESQLWYRLNMAVCFIRFFSACVSLNSWHQSKLTLSTYVSRRQRFVNLCQRSSRQPLLTSPASFIIAATVKVAFDTMPLL